LLDPDLFGEMKFIKYLDAQDVKKKIKQELM